MNADAIENAFYDAYGPRWVSTIYAAINEYKVLLELKPQYQADPHALSLLYFKSTNGPLIPLDTLAKLHQDTGPQTINHYGQLNAVTISFDLKPGASLGERGLQGAGSGQRRPCRPASARTSRARPRRSKARSATCGCC